MNPFAEHLAADRRLVILKLLAQAPDWSCSVYLLQAALGDFRHSVGIGALIEDLHFLQNNGVVILDTVAGVAMPRLTVTGNDVAAGRVVIAGVKSPIPGVA